MQDLRGNYISMIFQEPMTSLNPVFRIGDQMDEVIALHDGEGKTQGGDQGAHHRAAGDGRHRQQRGRLRDVPPRAVRRYAPARHDRHGAGLQPEAHHCRRADHRAGRDHPGTDPGSAAQPEGQASIPPLCSSPTTWASLPRWRTMSSSCTRAASSRRALSRRSLPHPRHPYTIGLMASKPVVGKKVDQPVLHPRQGPQPRQYAELLLLQGPLRAAAGPAAAASTPARSACPRRTRSAATATMKKTERRVSDAWQTRVST